MRSGHNGSKAPIKSFRNSYKESLHRVILLLLNWECHQACSCPYYGGRFLVILPQPWFCFRSTGVSVRNKLWICLSEALGSVFRCISGNQIEKGFGKAWSWVKTKSKRLKWPCSKMNLHLWARPSVLLEKLIWETENTVVCWTWPLSLSLACAFYTST